MSEKNISSSSSKLDKLHFFYFKNRAFALLIIISILIIGTFASFDTAEARRMGSGRSFGRQSQSIQRAIQRQQPIQNRFPSQANRTTNGALSHSRWLGPLAGLIAGLGIAGLMSHFGLGEVFSGMISNFIIISIFVFSAIWLIRKIKSFRNQDDLVYASNYRSRRFPLYSTNEQVFQSQPYKDSDYTNEASYYSKEKAIVPDNFNTDTFLRNAKVYFIRLQAAWDNGNMQDIREFTTPEMFAEIKLDFDERGNEKNQTDIAQLDAELLDIEVQGNEYIASVRFYGLMRESLNELASPFEEVWNLSKCGSEGWILAGIQQLCRH
ncbi:MAG: TIM44-like domain-containing protein [Burkholderia sp.]|nr:TIM44-like domain-containing protein [Burkholderia sp.]